MGHHGGQRPQLFRFRKAVCSPAGKGGAHGGAIAPAVVWLGIGGAQPAAKPSAISGSGIVSAIVLHGSLDFPQQDTFRRRLLHPVFRQLSQAIPDALCHSQRHHCVVSKPAAGFNQGCEFVFDVVEFVNGACDIPADRTEHTGHSVSPSQMDGHIFLSFCVISPAFA